MDDPSMPMQYSECCIITHTPIHEGNTVVMMWFPDLPVGLLAYIAKTRNLLKRGSNRRITFDMVHQYLERKGKMVLRRGVYDGKGWVYGDEKPESSPAAAIFAIRANVVDRISGREPRIIQALTKVVVYAIAMRKFPFSSPSVKGPVLPIEFELAIQLRHHRLMQEAYHEYASSIYGMED